MSDDPAFAGRSGTTIFRSPQTCSISPPVLRHIDDMRRQIAQRPQPGSLFEAVPVNGRKRVGHIVFVVGAVEVDHLAYFAAGDNLFRQLRRRVFM